MVFNYFILFFLCTKKKARYKPYPIFTTFYGTREKTCFVEKCRRYIIHDEEITAPEGLRSKLPINNKICDREK